MRLLARPNAKPALTVDGVLALGCNLGIETCFATRVLAHMSDSPARMLADVQMISRGADALDVWLDIHEYLVRTLRKFRGDAAPLRRFCADIVGVFEQGGPNPFIDWYRAVGPKVQCLRCVFDDSEAYARLVRELRLQNLDSGVLGPSYKEESMVIETGRNHFSLLESDLIAGYLARIVAAF